MGVINSGTDPFIEDFLEDHFANLSESDSEPPPVDPPKPRKTKSRSPAKPGDSTKRSGKLGAKKFRRLENTAQLMSMTDNVEFGEVSIYDFMPESVSAFAQVLKEKDMKVWNDFLNITEEEQKCFLHKHGKESDDTLKHDNQHKYEDCPSFSAQLCFQRINSRLRSLLKKHVPLGTLTYLENEVITFFMEYPHKAYISQLENGYDRLLLHALCQYLDLFSQSFDERGQRITKVENLNEEFSLPTALLSQYLEENCYNLH